MSDPKDTRNPSELTNPSKLNNLNNGQGPAPRWQRPVHLAMAACLGVMAISVFINVVQRRGRQRRTVAAALRVDGLHRRHGGLPGG